MALSEEAMCFLEEIATVAFKAALTSGGSVLISENGNLVPFLFRFDR